MAERSLAGIGKEKITHYGALVDIDRLSAKLCLQQSLDENERFIEGQEVHLMLISQGLLRFTQVEILSCEAREVGLRFSAPMHTVFRRQSIRAVCNLVVHYCAQGMIKDRVHTTQAIDISTGGMCLIEPAEGLPDDLRLQFEVCLPQRKGHLTLVGETASRLFPLEISAEVRSRRVLKDGTAIVGISFVGVEERTRAVIAHFVELEQKNQGNFSAPLL
ncbi:MAG: PilZ domain-containing protein [Chthonomonadaceae bacterium]|nr:PilZ domain-containing protein [Chthonomonadaceae bacterium]